MGRIYAVTSNGTFTAAGTDADLISIQPADDKPVRLRGFVISQVSEVGDAQEENLRVTVRRMTATVTIGSGGSAITAAAPPTDSAEPVWSFTARANDTAVATTTGTNQVLLDIGWNERNTPFDFWFPDERMMPEARQTEVLIIRIETTAADDLTYSVTALVEEL